MPRFSGSRFLTRGVARTIPRELQAFLWSCVDRRVVDDPEHTDWLQVFRLSPASDGSPAQKVTHTQEQPDREDVHVIACPQPISAKVYVVDDSTHVTMLLADEY